MLRLTGIVGLPPEALLPIGGALIGLGLWRHLAIAVVVGAFLLLKAPVSVIGGRGDGARQGGPR
jgi:hypothetical protein